MEEQESTMSQRATNLSSQGDIKTHLNKDGSNSDKKDPLMQDPVRLERRLGLWNGVAIIIGVIVGSGIFISPAGVFQESGGVGAALIVWAICGLLSLMGALCMAELGTSISDSGGDYTYIKLAYGPCVSFLYLWVTVFIILPCSNALAALTFANYVLQPFYDNCQPDTEPVRLVSLCIVMILTWINCYSVKWSIRLQNSFTLLKVVALVLITSFGAYYIITGQSKQLDTSAMWSLDGVTLSGLASAFYSGLYSYAGWNALNFVTEEIKDPIRNMPRAIIISITAITIIYVLVNVSYFAVLTPTQFKDATAIAVTFGKEAMGPVSFLMPISVALSTTSGLNALIFSSSRILFVGARQGQLFSMLNMVSVDKLSPIPSLIIVGVMSSIYLIKTEITALINYLVFIEASFGALAVSTVLVLRYKFPTLRRPLRVHTYIPVIYLVLSLVLILSPIYKSPMGAFVGTLILLSGLPVYYLTNSWQVKPLLYSKSLDKITLLTQKLTMSVTPDEE